DARVRDRRESLPRLLRGRDGKRSARDRMGRRQGGSGQGLGGRESGIGMLRDFLLLLLAASLPAAASDPPRPSPLRNGSEFQSGDVRSLQADDFANPMALWVERGRRLWSEVRNGRSCAACHGDAVRAMKGVAARYPRFDPSLGRVVDLDQRIDACEQAMT